MTSGRGRLWAGGSTPGLHWRSRHGGGFRGGLGSETGEAAAWAQGQQEEGGGQRPVKGLILTGKDKRQSWRRAGGLLAGRGRVQVPPWQGGPAIGGRPFPFQHLRAEWKVLRDECRTFHKVIISQQLKKNKGCRFGPKVLEMAIFLPQHCNSTA